MWSPSRRLGGVLNPSYERLESIYSETAQCGIHTYTKTAKYNFLFQHQTHVRLPSIASQSQTSLERPTGPTVAVLAEPPRYRIAQLILLLQCGICDRAATSKALRPILAIRMKHLVTRRITAWSVVRLLPPRRRSCSTLTRRLRRTIYRVPPSSEPASALSKSSRDWKRRCRCRTGWR